MWQGWLSTNSQEENEALYPTATRILILPITITDWKWILPQSNLQVRLKPQWTPVPQPCEKLKLGAPQQPGDNTWVCFMVHSLWDSVAQQ